MHDTVCRYQLAVFMSPCENQSSENLYQNANTVATAFGVKSKYNVFFVVVPDPRLGW